MTGTVGLGMLTDGASMKDGIKKQTTYEAKVWR